VEALAVSEGVGFPEALARARLGAPGAGPDVIPLLLDARAAVRAAAARALGQLNVASALPMLDRLRQSDAEDAVRAEAAISALALGADAAATEVVALLVRDQKDPEIKLLVRRAALALTRLGRLEALAALSELALDTSAEEGERLRAIAALGELKQNASVPTLTELLSDVRLRVAAADALGVLGGKHAQDALAEQLAGERYETARRAEARALLKLGDRRTPRLITRFLGMETSLPEGVRMLVELRALSPASARGALLADPSVRTGTWNCQGEACQPAQGAEVLLPVRGRPAGAVRVTWLVRSGSSDASLLVDGERFALKLGEQQLSMTRPRASDAGRFKLVGEGDVSVVALAVVPSVPEIPPPPPDPWDAGTP
jgi:hypothetical protein